MSHMLADLSNSLASAVEHAARSVVQVHSHRRPTAGVVFGPDLIAAPARALGDDTAVVRVPSGETIEGQVLGHAIGTGLGVVRVNQSGLPPVESAAEPRVGALAIAVGRTWSGGVMAAITNVAVIGGPLRTGRTSELARVIRIAQPPHGAFTGGALTDTEGRVLGFITGSAIRDTTVVIPATLAWDAAHQIVKRGGTRQGYLGISSIPVTLPARQRGASARTRGLVVTAVAEDSPAERGGIFVGDVVTAFAGEPIDDAEALLMLLRGEHIGKSVVLEILRGAERQDLAVTVGERPSRRG
jgi:S1-C subfamily serine protease